MWGDVRQRSPTTLTAATTVVLLASMAMATTAQDAEPSPASDTDEALPPYAAITGTAMLSHQVGSFETIPNAEPPQELWREWAWTGRGRLSSDRGR
jgi:hypothetical protein